MTKKREETRDVAVPGVCIGHLYRVRLSRRNHTVDWILRGRYAPRPRGACVPHQIVFTQPLLKISRKGR